MRTIGKYLYLEWLKFRRFRPFVVLTIAYVVLLPSLLFSFHSMIQFAKLRFRTPEAYFKFPHVWEYLAYGGSWLAFFLLGYLGVALVTYEFQHRTVRQNIMVGFSRRDFYTSKLAFITGYALFATAYFLLLGFVLGMIYTGPNEYHSLFQEMESMPFRYFLMIFSYMVFGMFIGFTFRKSALSVLIYFSYVFFIEKILRWVVHRDILYIEEKYNLYYPINAMSDLTPLPFEHLMREMSVPFTQYHALSPTQAIVTSLLWAAIFIGVGYYRFVRSDL